MSERVTGDMENIPQGLPSPPHVRRDLAIAEAAYALRDLLHTLDKIAKLYGEEAEDRVHPERKVP